METDNVDIDIVGVFVSEPVLGASTRITRIESTLGLGEAGFFNTSSLTSLSARVAFGGKGHSNGNGDR